MNSLAICDQGYKVFKVANNKLVIHYRKGMFVLGNPKKDSQHFRPSHLGTQPLEAGGNKGKKMSMKSNEQPKVIQTKGK